MSDDEEESMRDRLLRKFISYKCAHFTVLSIFSGSLMVFCLQQLAQNEKLDCNDKTTYWNMISFIIGIFTPNPLKP